MTKPILCLDFDGVIHSYDSGWKGADVIPDPPVPGALFFIWDAQEHFNVHIFSSRSGQPGGIQAMRDWLRSCVLASDGPWWEDDPNLGFLMQIKFPQEKPPAMVTLDDRAITFTGTWPSLDKLRAFQPWNRA